MITFWFFYGLTGLFIFWLGMETVDKTNSAPESYKRASISQKIIIELISLVMIIIAWPVILIVTFPGNKL